MIKEYLTQKRHNELINELKKLKTEGRQEVAEYLKQAKSLGDLSENFDYQEGKEEQFRLEQKIAELEEVLRNAVIIEKPLSSETIKVGSMVKIKKEKEILFFTIVGSNEADPTNGLISNESPLGRALLDKKINDEIKIETPKGLINYKILSIN